MDKQIPKLLLANECCDIFGRASCGAWREKNRCTVTNKSDYAFVLVGALLCVWLTRNFLLQTNDVRPHTYIHANIGPSYLPPLHILHWMNDGFVKVLGGWMNGHIEYTNFFWTEWISTAQRTSHATGVGNQLATSSFRSRTYEKRYANWLRWKQWQQINKKREKYIYIQGHLHI
jgi:hypothetical protein